ncbi:MAG: hypothetical protein HYV07_14695 [Deltaproteobacteria bacterium]|nr:hypothetical protein [Deltaproteobacteria bacterium]
MVFEFAPETHPGTAGVSPAAFTTPCAGKMPALPGQGLRPGLASFRAFGPQDAQP